MNTVNEILNILKNECPINLIGNREYFEQLNYCCNEFFVNYGDTMENKITSSQKLSNDDAIELFKEYTEKLVDIKFKNNQEFLQYCLNKNEQ